VSGEPLIGCLGHLNPAKRVPQLLDAFVRLRARLPGARLLLAGQAAPRLELDRRLDRLDLRDAVVREPYVDEARLWSLLAASDVVVSLRAPTMGETSGIALRALSLGKPLVVSDVGWFAELPDEVALKVPVDEHEVDVLAGALELLATREDARTAMAAAAHELAAREHSLRHVADLYAVALEEAAGGPAVRDAVLQEVTAAAAEVGIAAGSPEAAELGERLREARVGD
jgi:glycosyltransferase involved in cell wall biosynthesis